MDDTQQLTNKIAESGVRGGVLVIDDHADARAIIITLLSRLGRPALGVETGKEAVDTIEAYPESFGLALVDIILPDTDGMSLARELNRRWPGLGIVLLSGQLDEESRWVVSEEGFRFLPKPFSLKSLESVINEVLGDSADGSAKGGG